MSTPHTVFVDTSTFERAGFNISGHTLSAFRDACKAVDATLVLPQTIEHEIFKHAKQRATDYVKAISDANKRAAILGNDLVKVQSEYWLRSQVDAKLKAFFNELNVTRLPNSSANIDDVMKWYQQGHPHFGRSGKRYEFPDAVAVSSLLAHARSSFCRIAVVSSDDDWKHASNRWAEFSYFSKLPVLIEHLLNEVESLERYRTILVAHEEVLIEAIYESVDDFKIFAPHVEEPEFGPPKIAEVLDFEASVISLGEDTFTVEFTAMVEVEVDITYVEYSPYYDPMGPDDCTETVREAVPVGGVAKLAVDGGEPELLTFDLEPKRIELSFRPRP